MKEYPCASPGCLARTDDVCEDCGKAYCMKHADRCRHSCDDSVPGCHSIWKGSHNLNNTQEVDKCQ